jgi:hypothetical protein
MLAFGEAEDLPAEYIVGAHQAPDLVPGRGGRGPVGREYLQCAEGRAEMALVPRCRSPPARVRCRRGDQAERHYLGVLLRPDRGGAIAGRARPAGARAHDPDAAGPAIRMPPTRAGVLSSDSRFS